MNYYATDDLDPVLGNHILQLGSDIGFFEDLGNNLVRDVFGVVWDRSVDKDIRGCERVHASRTDPRRIPIFPTRSSPRVFRQYRERNREEARHVPRLPDRILALRTGLDPARDREPADGLLHQPGIRERTAGRDLRLQPAADRQGPRIRHRRGLLRGRLGAADRSDHGIRSLAGVHLPPSAADVRPRARSREIRDDTQLRRCGRAVRRPDLDRTELLQPLPAGGYGCR